MKYFLYIFILGLASFFASCENKTENFTMDAVTNYLPLQVGKYIIYRLDSTVFTLSGSKIEIHKYQVKHTVESETTDNQGRKTYVIHRLINNENATGSWAENGNYLVTPTGNTIEVINNNLRVVVLTAPLRQSLTWKGNSYLPLAPYKSMYDMTTGATMNQWQFTLSNFGDTTINNTLYKDVWTVMQNNDINNIPPSSPNTFGSKEVSIEKYAKSIGLVYKDYQIYEHQPPNADFPHESYTGFGITMWIVGHN